MNLTIILVLKIYLIGVIVGFILNFILDLIEKVKITKKVMLQTFYWSLLSWACVLLALNYASDILKKHIYSIKEKKTR